MTSWLPSLAFWTALAVLVYVYVGYPILLACASRIRKKRPIRRDESFKPLVTMIISAYNEERVIGDKLRNSLELDYPRDRLQIIVVSDASSDATDDVVRSFVGENMVLLRMPQRVGKTSGLNEAVRRASGDVLVFSDANAHYEPTAIAQLVRNFADPAVGAATGESRYRVAENDFSTESENAYWRYELALKRLESRLGSLIGGDGAIYAVRKPLYREMNASDLSDFVNPLQIVQQGYRNVYEPEAISYEGGAEDFRAEFRRKVRIVNRAWRATWKMRSLLNPMRHGFFSLQFLSHKVLRWLAPLFMISALAANAALAARGALYGVAFTLQLAFYALALGGWLGSSRVRQWRLLFIPYYFCAVNLASLLGLLEALRGRRYTTWNSSRREPGATATGARSDP